MRPPRRRQLVGADSASASSTLVFFYGKVFPTEYGDHMMKKELLLLCFMRLLASGEWRVESGEWIAEDYDCGLGVIVDGKVA